MKLPFFGKAPSTPVAGTPVSILKVGETDPIFSEQIKAMRAKIEYRLDTLQLKTIAVTSAISGEGKTTLSAKLAANLATSGRKRVLLIDTDFRKADLGRGIGISKQPGLAEYILGEAEYGQVIFNSDIPGFHILPAGMRISEPGDLLSGARFRDFLQKVRNSFDIILLDTPPILPVADTLSLRDQVDGFVFVYRASYTPHKMFQQAADEIGEKGIIGVVINGVEPERQRYYERYYGKYYVKPSVPPTLSDAIGRAQ